MIRNLFKVVAVAAGALLFAPSAFADQLKGAIVVMDLTTNAFQIEMAEQAVAYGKEIGADVKGTR